MHIITQSQASRALLQRNGFSQIEFVHVRPVEDCSGSVCRGIEKGNVYCGEGARESQQRSFEF